MTILDNYLKLITSQHRDKPKYLNTNIALLKPLEDIFNLAVFFDEEFDLDIAVGAQLDICGDILGRSRWIYAQIEGVYFAWDTEDSGWASNSTWRDKYDPIYDWLLLEDEEYRRMLKAKVLYNQWDGLIDSARILYNSAYADSQVIVQDNQNMSMAVGFTGMPNTAINRALLSHGRLFPRPAGVRIKYYIYSDDANKKLFAWDVDGSSGAKLKLDSWDRAYWGIELKPLGEDEIIGC